MIVRELLGGIYFGQPRSTQGATRRARGDRHYDLW